MLCYRCGTHVPDTAEKCPTCGQNLTTGGLRQATGTFSRRRPATSQIEGAPYKPQDLVANRYLIKDIVGAGPLGFVFRAHDKELDVEVALKTINPNLLQSAEERKHFAKEIRLARKLSHPNLVRVYEEGEDAERSYFTSQFLDGLTLRKIIDLRLQKGQFFSLGEVEPILAQVCAALDGAHKVGPHSDLKPENVLVLPDLLKVTDFGLGLAVPRLPFVQAMKARKAERYFPPELIDGNEIDIRADVYSLGVILGEMLCGETPDGSVPELQKRNPEVPPQLEGVYRKALNSNPNARFKTAGEMMGEISELARRFAPPPKTNPGGIPIVRTRSTTGMLQLSPRRESRVIPVVRDVPPPPPPITAETVLPDATVQMNAMEVERALQRANELDFKKDSEETEVIDSGMFIAQIDVEDVVDAAPPASAVSLGSSQASAPLFQSSRRPDRTWLVVVTLLVLLGLGVGAVAGLLFNQHQRSVSAAEAPSSNTAVVVPSPEGTTAQGGGQASAAEVEKLAADKAAEEKAASDKAAADKVSTEKDAAAKVASDKAEKIAAEKTAAQQAAAKLASDKAKAASERADRIAAERAAADNASAERAAARKAALEKAASDRAAEKAAMAQASADKVAAQKLAAEKLAAEKDAAQKAAAAAKQAAAQKQETDKPIAAKAAIPLAAAVPTCPEGMRTVASGAFKMGTAAGDPMMGFDEKALASVDTGSFCIDVFEFPNKRGVSPTANIAFVDAKRLCEAQSKRLCSEAEWEKSCKGPSGTKWVYGDAFDVEACNTEDDIGDARSLAGSGKFSKCRSGYGTSDMSGNVAEWTSERIIKGGSYASGDYAVRCSARKNGSSFSKSAEVGFRCCADPR